MKFVDHDLGNLKGGEVVEITISGSAANVRLLNHSNFQAYRRGRRHRYYGGHARRSPVRLQVPNSGHWHVVVDLGGYPGRVKSSARVLSGPLRPLREPPLSSVPSLVREPEDLSVEHNDEGRTFDVFISHASEDKETVARPLAHALREAGLEVWYDEFELRIGASLRQKIDFGLARSRFGVVVLSQAFFAKGWSNYELDGLVTRAVTGDQILLPIWHNVSKREVMEYSASLADKLARSTSTHTVEEIAAEIVDVIGRP